MYSFTNVTVLVGRNTAGCDMQCSYCFDGEHLGIKEGQDYFFIQGHRTYERIARVEENFTSFYPEQKFVPYIPNNLVRTLRRYTKPEDFRDIIKQHKMCLQCYGKLQRFFGIYSPLGFPRDRSQRIQVETRHTMRTYNSMSDRRYICRCCGVEIPGDTFYGRIGDRGTTCINCFKLLAPFIGEIFSY